MKMIYGGTPVNSLKVRHYEKNTNDATTIPSAVQAGLTYYANGEKHTGTGKSFEFANYGSMFTNTSDFVPTLINVIEIASLDYPIRNLIALNNMKNVDFSIEQNIGIAIIDGVEYPITAKFEGVFLTLNCEKEILLEVFYGKDNYI